MNKILFFLVFLISSSLCHGYDYKLSIAAITKDDNEYLKEWIEYHRLVGVEHFYIYDNNDNNQLEDLLKPYIKRGIVKYKKWPNKWPHIKFVDGCQVYAYQHVIRKAAGDTEWLAIIDTDEFLVPMQENTVVEALNKHYACHTLIYVNWKMFGTSNQFIKPGDPTLPKLTLCDIHDNDYGKTICRPEAVRNMTNVHFVESPYPYINGSGQMRTDEGAHTGILRLNHYSIRDENFMRNVKVPRNKRMYHSTQSEEEILQFFQAINTLFSTSEDFRILDVMNALR